VLTASLLRGSVLATHASIVGFGGVLGSRSEDCGCGQLISEW
jgi:hypothetical protein